MEKKFINIKRLPNKEKMLMLKGTKIENYDVNDVVMAVYQGKEVFNMRVVAKAQFGTNEVKSLLNLFNDFFIRYPKLSSVIYFVNMIPFSKVFGGVVLLEVVETE